MTHGWLYRRKSATGVAQSKSSAGFTLIEMLMVILLIGLIVSIALPGLKGMKRSNTIANANRQLLDDLSLARQRAILGRTTVRVMFVPPTIADNSMTFNTADKQDMAVAKQLQTGAYTTYALFAERAIGDQPGVSSFRYLSSWKTLPDGVFIADREFKYYTVQDWKDNFGNSWAVRPFEYLPMPFPTINGKTNLVPQIAFGPSGGLVDESGNPLTDGEVIELARGSILSQRDPSGYVLNFDVQEIPPNNSINNYNHIVIDGLTGRARIEQPQIQ